MSSVDPSVMVTDPTFVQVLPSADCEAVITALPHNLHPRRRAGARAGDIRG